MGEISTSKIPKMRFDYLSLADEIRRPLHNGESPMKADIARAISVGNAWVKK